MFNSTKHCFNKGYSGLLKTYYLWDMDAEESCRERSLHKMCQPKVPFSASETESFAIFPGSLPWLTPLNRDYSPPGQTWMYIFNVWENRFTLAILLCIWNIHILRICIYSQVHLLICQSTLEYQALEISIKYRYAYTY